MPVAESLYLLAASAARAVLPVVARGEGKLARGVRGRAGVLDRMRRWAADARDEARPLVWFHAPSVGEGLQARVVIEALLTRRPDAQVVYTYFSPSADRFARSVPAAFADYLPFDTVRDSGAALDALRPDVLAFSKYDVWPGLTRAAAERGVRLVLLSGTLPQAAGRLAAPARAVVGPAYRRLDHVAAISPEDAARFDRLGVPPERRSVMGDARFDQVWARAASTDAASPLLRPFAELSGPVLVAGSTWPTDEARLVPAFARMAREHPGTTMILAPHEPTEPHLAASEARLAGAGLAHARLAAVEAGARVPPVVVVDRVGVLGDLYAVASVAYVGGGFGRDGLHSVLEPAAFAAPVIFGPRHGNAREAAELIHAGGGFTVADDEALFGELARFAADEPLRERAGEAARAYVRAGVGAAARGAGIVEALLARR